MKLIEKINTIMTNDDITKVQIIADCKDGQHLISVSDDKILIRCIVEYCKFMLLKEESLEQCSLKEFITNQE